jgi:hypothetical protein
MGWERGAAFPFFVRSGAFPFLIVPLDGGQSNTTARGEGVFLVGLVGHCNGQVTNKQNFFVVYGENNFFIWHAGSCCPVRCSMLVLLY